MSSDPQQYAYTETTYLIPYADYPLSICQNMATINVQVIRYDVTIWQVRLNLFFHPMSAMNFGRKCHWPRPGLP